MKLQKPVMFSVFALMLIFLLSCSSDASQYTDVEKQMINLGLVDIAKLDSTMTVQLIYTTPHNFMGRQLYKEVSHAFIQPEAAQKLMRAKEILKSIRPDLDFIIYDAARPISVQHEMWDMVKDTPMRDFVSDPTKARGMHNYGVAIDLTLMSCTGEPLAMGSEYDFFGDESRINIESQLLESGRITQRELENRLLLRRVMTEAGFFVFDSEWWHFNSVTEQEAKETLKIIE